MDIYGHTYTRLHPTEMMRSHYKAILSLGLPIVAGQLGIMIFGVVDTLMVGHHSTKELSAAGFVNQIYGLAIVPSIGFAYGLTPIVGALFGQGKYTEIGGKLRNALFASLIFSLLICSLLLVFYFNLDRMGQPTEILPLIKQYFLILLLSMIPMILFNAFRQCIDGIQDTKVSMWILIIVNLAHIVSNYVFIYGWWIVPEMGLVGAGYSTLLIRTLMFVAIAAVFFLSPRYATYSKGFSEARINTADFQQLNTLGLPVSLMLFAETAAFSLCAIMVGWLGTKELAAHQIVFSVSSLFFMMYSGIGSAIAVRVSYFRGQGDLLQARQSAVSGTHIILAIAFICAVFVFLVRNHIGAWYVDDPSVQALVPMLILPLLIYQLSDSIQIAFAHALRGMTEVKAMLRYALFSYFIVSLPTSYLFAFVFNWGLAGIWYSFAVGLTVAGILYTRRFMCVTSHN